MKKKVMLGVIAAMVVSMSATVFAGPSIGQIIPEEPQIVSTNVPEGAKLVVSTIDVTDEKTLDNYTSNETVKTLLKTVNDENTKPTIEAVKEVLKEMNVEDVTNVETKSGEKVKRLTLQSTSLLHRLSTLQSRLVIRLHIRLMVILK